MRAGTGWRTSGSDMLTRSLVWRRKVVKIPRDAVPRKIVKGKRHPQFNLPTDTDGIPYILVILNMNTQDKKDVVHAFISFHYGM